MKPIEIPIAIIAGVRPQYIKMAALRNAIERFNHAREGSIHISSKYINCAQHYSSQLAGDLISELDLRFDYEISHRERVPTRVMAEILIQSNQILTQLMPQPRWVVVFGDANTTLATTIAARHSRLSILHIEAGVRSNNLDTEEEVNRRMVDHVSSLHFCSTHGDVQNLSKEGIVDTVFFTGDLAYDFVLETSKLFDFQANLTPGFVLVTIHKSENFLSDETLTNLIHVLAKYSYPIVFVTHPKTRLKLSELGLLIKGITFCESLPYAKMLSTIKSCRFVVTDSGGIQREAHYLKKRCLVLRKRPGWHCLVEMSFNYAISGETESIEIGLSWMESALKQQTYPTDSSPFFRPSGCDFALSTMVERSFPI